jgi:catechol 2,3-dioxygenase-like lactoylglutathione lyase family enzyme
MAQPSPARVKVESINQVAIVVWDLERVAQNFWNILGIGPWEIYNWEPPLVYDRKYHGQPGWARERIALVKVGGVQIELVQPVEGDSIYRDFLLEQGEGLHHMNFLVDDVDETAATLTRQGFPSIQNGYYGYGKQKSGFSYHPIKPLHTIFEPVHVGGPKGVAPVWLPDITQPSPARVKVESINQVAIVVWDLERVAQNFWNILGIGPWEIYNWEPPLVYDRKYHGQPGWARERIALVKVGGVQIELVQPVEGDSIYRDFLLENGEGLHHMNFLVDDVDETAATLTQQGFPSIQNGYYGYGKQKSGFSYPERLLRLWEAKERLQLPPH